MNNILNNAKTSVVLFSSFLPESIGSKIDSYFEKNGWTLLSCNSGEAKGYQVFFGKGVQVDNLYEYGFPYLYDKKELLAFAKNFYARKIAHALESVHDAETFMNDAKEIEMLKIEISNLRHELNGTIEFEPDFVPVVEEALLTRECQLCALLKGIRLDENRLKEVIKENGPLSKQVADSGSIEDFMINNKLLEQEKSFSDSNQMDDLELDILEYSDYIDYDKYDSMNSVELNAEREELQSAISNERLWQKGCDSPDDIRMHEQNIISLVHVLEYVNERIDELSLFEEPQTTPYRIRIEETYVREVEIFAEDALSAQQIAEDLCSAGVINIDYDDFIERSTECYGESKQSDLALHEVYSEDGRIDKSDLCSKIIDSKEKKQSLSSLIFSAEQKKQANHDVKCKQTELDR